jgi:N-acetylneuraminic acid mutarotase
MRKPDRRFRMSLEELESRLAPASFAVNAQLKVTCLDASGNMADTVGTTHSVVFFESSVADYQILKDGLVDDTDAVVLDSNGDGLREMAAFLAGRTGLMTVGVVAHGSPGALALGTATLDAENLGSYTRELAAAASALDCGGELDLWSCEVAAGQAGQALIRDLSVIMGASVAASTRPVGSTALGGSWRLDVRAAGAEAKVPFSVRAVGAFPELLAEWSPTAPLATPRYDHIATLLGNGKVLVAGGYGNGYLASAELYDPSTNTWSSAGSMADGRQYFTATLLANGKVLVAGGRGYGTITGSLASAELYDPATNSWSDVGYMATARDNFTATLLSNGKVLVAGGVGKSSAELFDPLTNTWSLAAPMATARSSPTATLLPNGKVLVAGGSGRNGTPLASAELYDPITDSWSAAASMAEARARNTATLLDNGKVLVAGGDGVGPGLMGRLTSAEVYDPGTNTWSSAGSMAEARTASTATLLGSGKVLVAGGFGSSPGALDSAELYDPLSNTWTSAGDMVFPASGHTATLLGNGNVLFEGGDARVSAELYFPTATAIPSLFSTGMGNLGVVVSDGAADPHYTLTSSPTGSSFGPAAYIVNQDPRLPGLWDRDSPTSKWIGPVANQDVMRTGSVEGIYTYRTTFDLTGFDPISAFLAGAWEADNAGVDVLINGKSTGITWSIESNGFSRFVISSGFQSGINTLDFVVNNTPNLRGWPNPAINPSGLRVELGCVAEPVDSFRSTVTEAPTSIPVGGTAKVTLTTRYPAGNLATTGGLPFSFGFGAATGNGTFSNLTDNKNGTYTADFTATAPGLITFTATLNGQPITSALPTLLVTAASQFAITDLNVTTLTAGSTLAFQVTAEDSAGHKVPSYTGTVKLTSTDGNALLDGKPLPASYSFVPSDSGSHTFVVTLPTAGTQAITVTDQASSYLTATTNPITVLLGVPDRFVVNVSGGNTLQAGVPFVFTAQAIDQFGKPVTSYTGPISVTATTTPNDPQGSFPLTGELLSTGFGVFQGSLKMAGSYAITVTAGSFLGTSSSLTVAPAEANYFTITAPANATTGNAFTTTIQAFDHYGNLATGYSGRVHFTSTDPNAVLPPDATLTGGVGTVSVRLNTVGSQTITATDTVSTNPFIVGTSSSVITRGLVVSSFTPTPTGFTATFSKPFVSTDLTLYGTGTHTVQDVTLVGKTSRPINGSLLIDPSNTSLTFKATATALSLLNDFGSVVLPDDTYTVTFVSGSGNNGFLDALGRGLDGANNGGQANYVTSFSTHYHANATQVLSIPDFARGPDFAHAIAVPNDTGHGIPVTLYNAVGVQDVTFTLSYNPSLLTVTGGSSGDATNPASFFTLMGDPTIIDPTHATANFHFQSSTPLTGTVVLGDVQALALGETGQANQGVVAYWRFEEGVAGRGASGPNSIVDSSGNGLNGTAIDTPAYRATVAVPFVPLTGAANNLALDFSGLGPFVTMPDYAPLRLTHSLTVEAYINLRSFQTFSPRGEQQIVFRGAASGMAAYSLEIVGTNLAFSIADASGAKATAQVPFSAYLHQWVHVAGSLDDATGNLSLYINGMLVASMNTPIRPEGNLTGYEPGLSIGNDQGGSSQGGSSYSESFSGLVDEVRISNQALQPSQFLDAPNIASSSYKAKELLQFSAITVNGSAFPGVSASGLHVNAYSGDVTGNGTIDGLDVATAATVAQGKATGFSAYPLLDPAIVGDVANDFSIDAGDVSTLTEFVSKLVTSQIPPIPSGITITPVGPDPTLSLGATTQIATTAYSVPVLIDQPHPEGSTGMTEAILALTYDPSVLSVSSAEITFGSIPGLATGWQLSSVVDQASGQIAITLYGTSAITATQAGSLVNIVLHVLPNAAVPVTWVQLVGSVAVSGQQFTTQVDDAEGQFILSASADPFSGATV